MLGFTYNGIHSSTYGCNYIPSAINKGRDMSVYTVDDIDREGADGGYYIGNEVNPRDFSQDCFVEEITPEQREGLFRWLDRNTSGRLVFDHRPHMYYDVRPTKRIEIMQYTHRNQSNVYLPKAYSGTFTISFKAYDPFGKLFRKYHQNNATPLELIETGILTLAQMPQAPGPTADRAFVHNCGFEKAHTIIRVAGTLEDMLIWNLTTNEKCLIKGLRASDLPVGAYLEIDSETGKVCIVNGAERELAMYYHDDGLITLAPCTPLTRDLRITSASGNTIYSDGLFLPHMVGQYFWISGTGYKIQRVDNASTATLYSTLTQATPFIVSIGTINDILIYGNENLTKLEIDYMPKIR